MKDNPYRVNSYKNSNIAEKSVSNVNYSKQKIRNSKTSKQELRSSNNTQESRNQTVKIKTNDNSIQTEPNYDPKISNNLIKELTNIIKINSRNSKHKYIDYNNKTFDKI